MSFFELGMIICFGIGWPVSVFKAIKTKDVSGKSPLFMIIILLGYLSGLTHKVVYSWDIVILVYLFNTIMVALDLVLYYKYSSRI